MTSQTQAFRLITQLELQTLQQVFEKKLQAWNKTYALYPLSLELKPPIPLALETGCIYSTQNEMQVFIPKDASKLIKHSLVGNDSQHFDECADRHLLTLLQDLLDTASLHKDETRSCIYKEWFYKGSPSLALTLNLEAHAIICYLHPQWVMQALPKRSFVKKPKISLTEALSSQLLACQVALKPLSLPFKDISNICVGDVISCTQPIQSLWQLSYKEQTLCQVSIGKTQLHKSIQIVSPL